MNAGLPGTGLGGLFYIASALVMPMHRVLAGHGHDGRSWRRVLRQSGLATGVLAALFATGWVLGLLLAGPSATAGAAGGAADAAATPNLVRWIVVAGTAGLLATLLVVVEALGFALRPAPAHATPSPSRALVSDGTERLIPPVIGLAGHRREEEPAA